MAIQIIDPEGIKRRGATVVLGPGLWLGENDDGLMVLDTDASSGGGGGGGGGGLGARETFTFSTSSLAHLGTEEMDLVLHPAWVIWNVATNYAARVRFYTNPTSRTTDAARPIGTEPLAGRGVLGEFVTGASLLSIPASPVVHGANLDSPVSQAFYVHVQNRSGIQRAISVTLILQAMEE